MERYFQNQSAYVKKRQQPERSSFAFRSHLTAGHSQMLGDCLFDYSDANRLPKFKFSYTYVTFISMKPGIAIACVTIDSSVTR